MKSTQISRKSFLNWLGWMLFAAVAIVWHSLTDWELRNRKKNSLIKIPAPVAPGLTIYGQAITFRDADSIKVYSAKCTHLGCLISKIENETLVCQCHGSRFSKEGTPLKGPASRPLDRLGFTKDADGGITVYAAE
ncbi:MAG: ubiquinol-cytochrome c reductase iron-sulfur subunit [Syntrophomonadaceae bacterium]